MSSSSVTFSGSSTYSSSFQQVLQRAVSIASLPITQMSNQLYSFQGQQSALGVLQGDFGSLQNALQSIASVSTGGVSANSSDQTVAVAAAQTGTLPGTYQLEVDDVGSSTSTISSAGNSAVTDSTTGNISSSLSYTLTVNNTPHTLTLTSGTLQSLATAINDANAGVQATIVNLGSNNSPDYRLSVTSSNLGPDTIQLNDGTKDLLTQLNQGGVAKYKVNGNSTQLTSTSDKVTLAPGLTATLLSSSSSKPISITVAANENALSSALSNFATAYNSAVDAVAQHRGQAGGALSGESVVFSLSQTLSQISQYVSGTGTAQSLTDIGLSLDSSGHLSFDSSQFSNLNSSEIQQFLGSISGGGFLQTANNALTTITDSTNGVLASQLNSISSEITAVNNHITDAQSRVTDLQTSLQAKLSAADAAIAVLEQQKTFYQDMFQVQYGKQNT